MQESSPSSKCPTCQSPIPADAPGGLCPACALERAASVPSTGISGRHTPPQTIEDIAPQFPDLEILELLGAGGMGAVYKARQPQLDRTVALKILSHDLAQEPAFVERFNREGKMLARLSHPNIVAIFDFGTAGPYCYLLMEYVDGVNLRQAMRTGGFKPQEALVLVQDVCSALQFAHEEGILHRDIKPENILIDSKGRVKIADFGIAKLVGAGTPSDVTLTLQGSILGSPHYMAPEQIETPGDVDQRADIYSLGVVLYEMLTGELPIGRFALPSEKAAMDARIDAIVLRTLEKEREYRYQTVSELRTDVLSSHLPSGNRNPATSFFTGQILFASKLAFTFAIILLVYQIHEILVIVGPGDDLVQASQNFRSFGWVAVLMGTLSAILRAVHQARIKREEAMCSQSDAARELARKPSAPVSDDAHCIARFSLAGAVLTGLSLVGIIAGAYLGNEYRDLGLTREAGRILSVVMMILGGMMAITGLIFGSVALGSIRRSGGILGGLGGSLFAVVTWPVLMLGAFGSLFLSMPQPGNGGSVGFLILLPVLGGAMAIAAFVLVRGLRRWARGVTDKNGAKRHPGLLLPVLGALGAMVVSVGTIETIGRLSHGAHEEDVYAYPYPEVEIPTGVESPRVESSASITTSDGRMHEWRLRDPEVSVPFSVPAGERLQLQLELQVNHDAPETIWEAELSGPLERPAVLELGTQLKTVSGPPGGILALVVKLIAPGGGSLHSTRDLRGWVFDAEYASKIDPAATGHQRYVIASLDEDDTPSRSGTLTLFVTRDSSESE
jgi:tRNA A-37 threonylcarbamoyl transferase component Bud32